MLKRYQNGRNSIKIKEASKYGWLLSRVDWGIKPRCEGVAQGWSESRKVEWLRTGALEDPGDRLAPQGISGGGKGGDLEHLSSLIHWQCDERSSIPPNGWWTHYWPPLSPTLPLSPLFLPSFPNFSLLIPHNPTKQRQTIIDCITLNQEAFSNHPLLTTDSQNFLPFFSLYTIQCPLRAFL